MSLLSFHLDPRFDWIHLNEQKLNCIIGILEKERIHPQALIIDIAFAIDRQGFEACAFDSKLDKSVNYATIYELIGFLGNIGKFRLLESFACVLLKLVLSKDWVGQRQIQACYCQLRKPEILPQATSGVSIYRDLNWAEQSTQIKVQENGNTLELIAELEESRITKLSLIQGAYWHGNTQSTVKILSGIFQDSQGNQLTANAETSSSLMAINAGVLLCIEEKQTL